MSTLQGDAPCHECGTSENIVWFTDNVLWNNAIRGDDHGDAYGYAAARWGVDPVLCLPCFISVCEDRGYRPTGWRVTPEWPIRREGGAVMTGHNRTTWRALIVALLHRRPETRGVSPLADVLDEAARWGA